MGTGFSIEGREVGEGAPPLIVAEVAQAHDGSLGCAHAYIDAVAKAGADAVKFQTHIAAAESTPGEPWRIQFSRQDPTRYAYWQRMEFSPEQWVGLREHAREVGLIFLSSPFSLEALELLERIETPAYKIGSGEVSNHALLDAASATAKPVLLSSGMSGWKELDAAVARLQGPKAVLQCTSSYPCPPERVGLGLVPALAERYGCPTGLSDHSATPYAGLGAVTLGASIVEVHVVFHQACFGPDTSSSLTLEGLATLVEGSRFLHAARAGLDKDGQAEALRPMRQLFEKSVVLRAAGRAGQELGPEDLAFKKPGTGIPARRYAEVVGRRLARSVAADVPLREEDLQHAG